MNISLLDASYEKDVCKKLLEITRYVYAMEASTDLPTATQVMAQNVDATPEMIRAQIQDNLDFLRVNFMYATLDREALRRELATAQSKRPGGQ